MGVLNKIPYSFILETSAIAKPMVFADYFIKKGSYF